MVLKIAKLSTVELGDKERFGHSNYTFLENKFYQANLLAMNNFCSELFSKTTIFANLWGTEMIGSKLI